MMSLMSRCEAVGWMDAFREEDCRLWATNSRLGVKQPLHSSLLRSCDLTYTNGTAGHLSGSASSEPVHVFHKCLDKGHINREHFPSRVVESLGTPTHRGACIPVDV